MIRSEVCLSSNDVRDGSITEIRRCARYVRFAPDSGHEANIRVAICPLVYESAPLVQLVADVVDALGDQLAGELALGFLGEHLGGGGEGGLCRGATHVGGGLRFGLGDLDLGHLGAPRNEFL